MPQTPHARDGETRRPEDATESPTASAIAEGRGLEETDDVALVDWRADLAVALAVVGLGVFLMVASMGVGDARTPYPDAIGPGAFAAILGSFITAAGIVLVVRRIRASRKGDDRLVYADGGQADEPGHPTSAVRPLVIFVLSLVWTQLLPVMGFIVPTALLTAVIMYVMRMPSWGKIVLVSVFFSLLRWVLFTRLAGLTFPPGLVDDALGEIVPRMD